VFIGYRKNKTKKTWNKKNVEKKLQCSKKEKPGLNSPFSFPLVVALALATASI
jgi:hypothetical protein